MEDFIKKYAELTSKEIKQIENLIIKGCEVDSKTLPERLSNTERISFFKENDEVISTASIKKPTDNYKTKIFIKSRTNRNNNDFLFELGYVSTDKNFQERKLASKLCYKLCKLYSNHSIFSTTRVDNESMKSILAKNNFKETGIEFPNKEKSNFLKLYLYK
jgi:hypothetical protein